MDAAPMPGTAPDDPGAYVGDDVIEAAEAAMRCAADHGVSFTTARVVTLTFAADGSVAVDVDGAAHTATVDDLAAYGAADTDSMPPPPPQE